jgi:hypothetical protein
LLFDTKVCLHMGGRWHFLPQKDFWKEFALAPKREKKELERHVSSAPNQANKIGTTLKSCSVGEAGNLRAFELVMNDAPILYRPVELYQSYLRSHPWFKWADSAKTINQRSPSFQVPRWQKNPSTAASYETHGIQVYAMSGNRRSAARSEKRGRACFLTIWYPQKNKQSRVLLDCDVSTR